jgi:[ribosomal protein S5]-alanine N-acetyltransferase
LGPHLRLGVLRPQDDATRHVLADAIRYGARFRACEHGGVSATRLVTLDDAPILADLVHVSRDFLAPWEPVRNEGYFTPDGQRAVIRDALAQHEQGSNLPHVILDDSGRVVGRITLNGIVRGPFQSCSMGYWVSVSVSDNGRGHATAAVRDIVRVAFGELGLHLVQAETVLHNVRSQRILERNGFVRFGMAPAYLKIAGKWQDHFLYPVVKSGPA